MDFAGFHALKINLPNSTRHPPLGRGQVHQRDLVFHHDGMAQLLQKALNLALKVAAGAGLGEGLMRRGATGTAGCPSPVD